MRSCSACREVSRPGNGGINLGLGTSFFGLYTPARAGPCQPFLHRRRRFRPGARCAAKLKEQGVDGDRRSQSQEPHQRRRSAVPSPIRTGRACSCQPTATRDSATWSVALRSAAARRGRRRRHLQAAGADGVERVLRGVPRLVVEIDDVDRRHAGREERQVVVLDLASSRR